MFYKIFMLIAIPAIAIGWIAYAIWIRRVEAEEKKQPKPGSERLQKTKREMSDWAKQMAQFKKPTYKRPDEDNKDK